MGEKGFPVVYVAIVNGKEIRGRSLYQHEVDAASLIVDRDPILGFQITKNRWGACGPTTRTGAQEATTFARFKDAT